MKPSTPSLDTLFGKAIEIPSAEEREKYLDAACGSDPHLRSQLEKLVADYYRAGDFLEQPAALWEAAPAPPPAEAGQMVDRYRLIEQIGEGGMGVVFVAEQTEPVRRRVALKIIKPGMDSRQVIARFEAERQTLALMDHPHIARVIDGGTTEQGRPYFVMELVKGIPITTYCHEANLSLTERLKLFVSVCQAVQHAHQKGIIHRDIKPSNVLVTMLDGQAIVKVIDFGIAKVIHQPLAETAIQTGFSQMVGTPLYMSPEQAALSAVDVDTRSDVYSLSVLLYELLTGTTPFENDTLAKSDWDEMRRIIREVEPPRPSQRISTLEAEGDATVAGQIALDNRRAQRQLRGELDWIVMKALDKDRARRYQSPAELADDVERYLSGAPVFAMPPSRMYRVKKYVRRHAAALITTVVVALSLILGTGISIWQAVDANAARGLAETRYANEKTARSEEAKAQAVTAAVLEFINKDLLGVADPENQIATGHTPDRELKLRTVVDRAAKKMEHKFEKQPLVEATLRTTLGEIYASLGDTTEAQEQFERSVSIYRRESGKEDKQTLYLALRLGRIQFDKGNYAQARKMFEEALESTRQNLSAGHEYTLIAMMQLSAAYYAQGDFGRMEPLDREAYETSMSVHGPDAEITLHARHNLAMMHFTKGDFLKAKLLLEELLEACRRKLSEENRLTVILNAELAATNLNLGNYSQARDLLLKVVDTRRQLYTMDHPDTLISMHDLAVAYSRLNDFDDAERLYKEVLETRRRVLSREHPDTLRTVTGLFMLYEKQGMPEKAEPLLRDTLEIRERTQPGEWRTFESRSMLGACLLQQGKLDEAEPLLLSGYEGMQAQAAKIPANRSNRIPLAIERVVKLYEAKKDAEQLAKWQAKLDEARAALPKPAPGAGATPAP